MRIQSTKTSESKESKSKRNPLLSEAQVVANITHNSEATMGQIVSRSVAQVILKLRNIYYGPEPSEERLIQEYKKCLTELRALTPKQFIRQGDNPKTQAKITQEIEEELKPVIDYIIAKTEEKINQLDIVALPDLKDKSKELTYEFPLKVTLPLLWRAYNDDEKFVQPGDGTFEERLTKARSERPLRLTTFFRCLKRAKQGICHQGVRHELILLLNKVFDDINIIEDAASTIQSFLKERLYTLFWHAFDKEQNIFVKNQLIKELFNWMRTGDASKIITLIDPKNTILKSLKEFFIQQGSDPDKLQVQKMPFDDFVNLTSENLNFACDPKKHFIFHLINKILTAIEINNKPKRNAALNIIQDWIQTKFEFETKGHDVVVSDFYTLLNAYDLSHKYESLLLLSASMTDVELGDIRTLCNDAFQKIQEDKGPFTLPKPTLSKLESFSKDVQKCKKHNLCDQIENFFINWYEAIDIAYDDDGGDFNNIEKLYTMLIDETIRTKIRLTDNGIQEIINKNFNAETGVHFVSPYEINRVFLHAIITNPKDWTPHFARVFKDVLTFVKDKLKSDDMKGIAEALQKDSYHEKLIRQMEYLYLVWGEHTGGDKEKEEIREWNQSHPSFEYTFLLPENVRTKDEWLRINDYLSNSQIQSICDGFTPRINSIMDECIGAYEAESRKYSLYYYMKNNLALPQSIIIQFMDAKISEGKRILEKANLIAFARKSIPLFLVHSIEKLKHISKEIDFALIMSSILKILDEYGLVNQYSCELLITKLYTIELTEDNDYMSLYRQTLLKLTRNTKFSMTLCNLKHLIQINKEILDAQIFELLVLHDEEVNTINIPSRYRVDEDEDESKTTNPQNPSFSLGLNMLYKTEEKLINRENCQLMLESIDAENIAKILKILFISNPALLNDENRQLIAKINHFDKNHRAEHKTQDFFPKSRTSTTHQESRLSFCLQECLQILFEVNKELINARSFHLLADHSEDKFLIFLQNILDALVRTNKQTVSMEILVSLATTSIKKLEIISTLFTEFTSSDDITLINEDSIKAIISEDIGKAVELLSSDPDLLNADNFKLLLNDPPNSSKIIQSLKVDLETNFKMLKRLFIDLDTGFKDPETRKLAGYTVYTKTIYDVLTTLSAAAKKNYHFWEYFDLLKKYRKYLTLAPALSLSEALKKIADTGIELEHLENYLSLSQSKDIPMIVNKMIEELIHRIIYHTAQFVFLKDETFLHEFNICDDWFEKWDPSSALDLFHIDDKSVFRSLISDLFNNLDDLDLLYKFYFQLVDVAYLIVCQLDNTDLMHAYLDKLLDTEGLSNPLTSNHVIKLPLPHFVSHTSEPSIFSPQHQIDQKFRHAHLIFLHAFIIEPEEWSPRFANAFNSILNAIKIEYKEPANIPDICNDYPPALMEQLEYLQQQWKKQQSPQDEKLQTIDKPEDMITLPDSYGLSENRDFPNYINETVVHSKIETARKILSESKLDEGFGSQLVPEFEDDHFSDYDTFPRHAICMATIIIFLNKANAINEINCKILLTTIYNKSYLNIAKGLRLLSYPIQKLLNDNNIQLLMRNPTEADKIAEKILAIELIAQASAQTSKKEKNKEKPITMDENPDDTKLSTSQISSSTSTKKRPREDEYFLDLEEPADKKANATKVDKTSTSADEKSSSSTELIQGEPSPSLNANTKTSANTKKRPRVKEKNLDPKEPADKKTEEKVHDSTKPADKGVEEEILESKEPAIKKAKVTEDDKTSSSDPLSTGKSTTLPPSTSPNPKKRPRQEEQKISPIDNGIKQPKLKDQKAVRDGKVAKDGTESKDRKKDGKDEKSDASDASATITTPSSLPSNPHNLFASPNPLQQDNPDPQQVLRP